MVVTFKIMIKFVSILAALFSASYAIPPVSAPSPITETTVLDFALNISCAHKSRPARNRSGGMSRIKAVAVALFAFRKSAHSAVFAQMVEALASAGQQLMGVGLMPDVPDQLVLRKIQHTVQRDRQLHDTEIGRQMTTVSADLFNEKRPDFRCELR